ncbi:hypothetical protein [Rhodococcus marinonascens]|uniref:hypothetical protein n=1 Tax=Rhodococcus marinonascens TaxID=38311 RepID=UPI0009343246|nr:hypothetical protein [Rhodococcus marinonascens]
MRQTDSSSTLLLTKRDIAALAQVQRPVVTTWAKRFRSGDLPFPCPVTVDGRTAKFDADEVVAWVQARGLGNNDAFARDIAMHAAFEHSSGVDPVVFADGITALLCVKSLLGEQLGELDPDALLDEVDELDPDDEFLCSEVDALGDHLAMVAAHVDRMADAAFTPDRAFEALMARRFREGWSALADTTLTAGALTLCARVGAALAVGEHPLFVDPAPDSTDLLVTLRELLPEYSDLTLMTGASNTAGARLARRRLAVHRAERIPPPDSGFGDRLSLDRPAMFLMQYPSPSTIDYTDGQMLGEIDNIAMQMGPGHRAAIIGPAGGLVDQLRDRECESIRSGLLRSGHLRAAIRLPEGLLPARPGLSMALWVLGAVDNSVPATDRHIVLADLGAVELSDDVIHGVLADVTAAMGSSGAVRAHAFRFGYARRTSDLLAEAGRLTALPRVHRLRPNPAEIAAQVLELVGAADVAAAGVEAGLDLRVEYRDPDGRRVMTAGELADAKELRVVSGNRLDADDIEPGGTVPVIGVDEVSGRCAVGSRGIDRLTFTAKYASGRYTAPGDIVFCTGSAFGALVDHEGASVVQWPARILRIADPQMSGLIPELAARQIRSRGPAEKPSGAIRGGSAWRQWEIPRVRPDDVAEVTAALADLRARRAAASALLDTLEDLTTTLADGVAHGALTVTPSPETVTEKG